MLGFPDSPAILFQFTPLREGRRNRFAQLWVRLVDFNSRPSARGDTASGGGREEGAYFNSRPSARGDGSVSVSTYTANISIHAPPRGATLSVENTGW